MPSSTSPVGHPRSLVAAALLLCVLLVAPARPALADSASSFTPRQAVVLIHGLGRTRGFFDLLSAHLIDAGYAVCAVGYPSLTRSPEALLETVAEQVADCPAGESPPAFVTHSLGGILLRGWAGGLEPAQRAEQIGPVVMLGPPNGGSEAVDVFGRPPIGWFIGPTGRQLGTDEDSLPNRVPRDVVNAGVIAGDRPVHVGSLVMDGPSDGLVTVTSTLLPDMRDHVIVNRSHVELGSAPEVIAAVLSYLADGCFDLSITGVREGDASTCAQRRARRAALAP